MSMTSNSPGFRALRMLQEHGQPMSEEALAVGLDVGAEEVGGLLGYPMRIGAIQRSRQGDHYYYRVGNLNAIELVKTGQPLPTLEPATVAAPVKLETVPEDRAPAPAPAPARAPIAASKVARVAPVAKAVPKGAAAAPVTLAPLKIPTLAEHLARSPSREMTADTADDAADMIEEALAVAMSAGVDIDAVHRRAPGGITEARDLISAALPLLTVRRFDCAQFRDGRLMLELDGTTVHLTSAHAAQLFDCMQGTS